ncbi:hypothetical protein IV38_GL000554 [Lactobacillus selangorensis]|uniref:Ribosomal processing cysteine protease Prp n=1 Tax=Lactobacillus selangorensis TaxID=81857 RepID=A0A0R2FM56_9LACO|nr:ribosomal-processing cysteine protease Prp [Lactobacillus selangorensis]KRN29667.1 hypothetical protein IV38_GL000554 [Lactobacillus selangorensis]KRN33804.1 hypothetical protein IV40_GL000114 [Lactobacillus selangorensis]
MIRANFKRDTDGNIDAFELTGHADAGPYGSDIVCAAVSAVSIGTVNGIESLAGFEPEVQSDTVNGGHLTLKITEDALSGEQANIAGILLENLLLELQSIQEQYGQYLSVKTQQTA